MANEIEAIATNNYVLATQQAVTHDNSMSGNGTVDSPLGLNNETVLWSGSTRVISAISASPLQLSGSLYDYDRIAVYTKTLPEHSETKTIEFTPESAAQGVTLLTCFKGGGIAMRFGCAFMQYTNTGVYFQDGAFQLSLTGGTSQPTATNQTIITKIIGINRKAQ